MAKWQLGGFREQSKQYLAAYTQIDTEEHMGKIRVFEPDSHDVAAQIVREHNSFAAMVEALELFKRAFPYEKEFIEGSVQHKAIVAREAALRLAKGG